jgi:uncharacterized repeat protein (TIGR01451 family)/CSLREA domain-containing protein
MSQARVVIKLARNLSLVWVIVFLTGVVLNTLPAPEVDAAGIQVNTFVDELNHNGNCSLREAIQAANTDRAVDACPAGSGADTIILSPGGYRLLRMGPGEDANQTGDLDIRGNLEIYGAEVDQTIIDGNQLDRVLHLHPGAIVTINYLHITGGQTLNGRAGAGQDSEAGGGIFNQGTLTLNHCAVHGNKTGNGSQGLDPVLGGAGGDGGGIYTMGNLTLNHSFITSNSAGNGGNGGEYRNASGDGGSGGGIFIASGVVMVNNSIISGNTTGNGGTAITPYHFDDGQGGDGGAGGGIYNLGILTVNNSTISDNITGNGGDSGITLFGGDGGSGGGISLRGGVATVNNSTIHDNRAGHGGYGLPVSPNSYFLGKAGQGGGIFNRSALTLTNSTVSGNRGGDPAYVCTLCNENGGVGGIYSFDPQSALFLEHSTVSNNKGGRTFIGEFSLSGSYGGILGYHGTIHLKNTILADNFSDRFTDCGGKLTSLEYSLIEDPTGCTISETIHSLVSQDPHLLPLADNGGATSTQALQPTSPTIDAGSCSGISTDQRGWPRPVDIPGIDNLDNGCDIGAFEIPAVEILPAKTVDHKVPDLGQLIVYTITVENKGAVAATHALISDTLPDGLTLAGPVSLNPLQSEAILAQHHSDLPALASHVLISAGQQITLTFPVMVNLTLPRGAVLVNRAAVSCTEVITPQEVSQMVTILSKFHFPTIFKNSYN